MKNNYFKMSNYKLSFLVGVVLVMSIFSCKLTKPREGVMVKIKQPVSNGTIVVNFINATTGAPIGATKSNQNVSVKLVGTDASKVANPSGAGADIISKSGFVILELIENVVPSETSPIKFFINCSASGFISTTVPVEISTPGSMVVEVKMSEVGNLPDGTSRVAVSLDIPANGVTTKETAIKLPVAKGNDKTTATMTIPQGQKFFSESGELISNEKLNISISKTSSTEQESLEAFPNTLQANLADGTSGYFKTAGLLAIEMTTSSGKKVKTFEKPNNVTVGVPATLTDDKGKVIAIGDKVPVWSHSEQTGVWTAEGDATFEAGKGENAGQLEATFPVKHLSAWNLDWWGVGCNVSFKIESNFPNDKFVQYIVSNTFQWFGSINANIKNNETHFIARIPASTGITITPTTSGFTEKFNLKCGANTVKITTLNPNPTPITLDLTVVCTNNQDSKERLDLNVLYRKAGTGNYVYLGKMVKGVLITNDLLPGNYDFQASYTTNEGGTKTYNVLNKQIVSGVNTHDFPTQCFN